MDRRHPTRPRRPVCQDALAYLLFKVVHAPYRIAAPPEPDAPDPVDAYESLLRARAVRSRRVTAALLITAAALFVAAMAEAPPRTRERTAPAVHDAPKIAAAREIIATSRSELAMERQRFVDAITLIRTEEREGTVARSSSPCPIALPTPHRLGRAFPLAIVARDDAWIVSSSIESTLGDLRKAEQHLDGGRFFDGIARARALVARSRLHHDVVVFADLYKRPLGTNASTFEPGEIRGRAYLYDFREHRVACAGDVAAKSSKQIEYTYPEGAALDVAPNLSSSLDADLDMQLETEIVKNLTLVRR
jgi:hypothetical protein